MLKIKHFHGIIIPLVYVLANMLTRAKEKA